MGRTTTYLRPSITAIIDAAESMEELAVVKAEIDRARAAGKIEADPKTVRRWAETLWTKVIFLLVRAKSAREAAYIYTVQMPWEKPASLAAELERILARVCASMPDEVELAARRGVVIEGVSTPEQIATAEHVAWVVRLNPSRKRPHRSCGST